MMNMSESVNANKMMYREWFPAIMYNHHQTGPAGAVLFAPPFRDPFNYNFDPLIPLGIDMVGAAIHTRLAAEGKPGAVMRTGATYSTWFNGGLRTTSYFHNQIGILTETIGNPTPVEIPFVPDMQLPRADVPYPIAPQIWHFRQSIEYSMTTNYAILDLASKRHEDFLFNMYQMGKNAIDKGSRDNWTIHPKRIEAAAPGDRGGAGRRLARRREHRAARRPRRRLRPRRRAGRDLHRRAARSEDARSARLHPAVGSARLPDRDQVRQHADQGRRRSSHRATAPFTVAGKQYPAGSYVVKAAQPFRAHLMDMFEPQDHPDDFRIRAARRVRRTTSPATTSPYSMGIKFDRILDAFDGPFEKIADRRRRCRRARSRRRRPAAAISSATRSTTRSSPSTGC